MSPAGFHLIKVGLQQAALSMTGSPPPPTGLQLMGKPSRCSASKLESCGELLEWLNSCLPEVSPQWTGA